MARALARSVSGTITRDIGLAAFQSNVLLLMGFGVLTTGLIGSFVENSPAILSWVMERNADGKPALTWTWWIMSFVELGLVGVMASWMGNRSISGVTGLAVFALYAAFNGLTIAPILSLYTTASVLKVFSISAATFGACALWGVTTKRDLQPLGGFLLVGLMGLLVLMIAQIFFRFTGADLLISVLGIGIFAGLTAYDMQQIRMMYDTEGSTTAMIVNGALVLYLDFINLFLFFLSSSGDKD